MPKGNDMTAARKAKVRAAKEREKAVIEKVKALLANKRVHEETRRKLQGAHDLLQRPKADKSNLIKRRDELIREAEREVQGHSPT